MSLLREILTRILEVRDEGGIGDFRPLVDEINELDLATKLGFRGSPLVFAERTQPPHRYVRFLIWKDPYGTSAGECWLSAPTVFGGQEVDSIGQRSKARDRTELTRVIRRWVRAVQGLQEPETYPVIPHVLHKDAPPKLWADPLWRELHKAIGWISEDRECLWEQPYHADFGWNVMQINRLARESGLPGGVIFRWDGSIMSLHDSRGSRYAGLSIASGHRIKKPERVVLGQVVACLEDWRNARETQVLGSASKTADPPISDGRTADEVPPALAKKVGKHWTWNYPEVESVVRAALENDPTLIEIDLAKIVASRIGASLAAARGAVRRAKWRNLRPAQTPRT